MLSLDVALTGLTMQPSWLITCYVNQAGLCRPRTSVTGVSGPVTPVALTVT